MSKARDFAIVMWVVMQGLSWFYPPAYGRFEAMSDVAYQKAMEELGYWSE